MPDKCIYLVKLVTPYEENLMNRFAPSLVLMAFVIFAILFVSQHLFGAASESSPAQNPDTPVVYNSNPR